MSGWGVTVAKSFRATESCKSPPSPESGPLETFLPLLLCVTARSISRPPLPPQLSVCLLPLLSDFSVPSHTHLARPSHCAGKTTAFRCFLSRGHLSTPHQPGAGGLFFSLSALSVMAPQQFCKRAPLKVYPQCFLGTEKVVMVLWFIS